MITFWAINLENIRNDAGPESRSWHAYRLEKFAIGKRGMETTRRLVSFQTKSDYIGGRKITKPTCASSELKLIAISLGYHVQTAPGCAYKVRRRKMKEQEEKKKESHGFRQEMNGRLRRNIEQRYESEKKKPSETTSCNAVRDASRLKRNAIMLR